MAAKRYYLVGIIAVWTIMLSLAIWYNLQPIRLLLGVPFVFLLPGYLLIRILALADGSALKNLALSLSGSIILVALVGLLLVFALGQLAAPVVYLCVGILVLVLSIAKPSSLNRQAVVGWFRACMRRVTGFWSHSGKSDRFLVVVSITMLLCIIGALAFRLSTIRSAEKYTEFYLLGQQDITDTRSLQLLPGERNLVRFGVWNHEQRDQDYSVFILAGSDVIFSTGTFQVQAGDKFELQLPIFLPADAGYPISLELYLAGSASPYRRLVYSE